MIEKILNWLEKLAIRFLEWMEARRKRENENQTDATYTATVPIVSELTSALVSTGHPQARDLVYSCIVDPEFRMQILDPQMFGDDYIEDSAEEFIRDLGPVTFYAIYGPTIDATAGVMIRNTEDEGS